MEMKNGFEEVNSDDLIQTHYHGCSHSHRKNDDERSHWRRFMEHTSCHGVFQIQNSATKAGKYIWTLIVLIAATGLIGMVSNSVYCIVQDMSEITKPG